MRSGIHAAVLALTLSGSLVPTFAASTVVFPNARELPSPDGRFLVRNAERQAPSTDFVGTFHSIRIVELATGRSRELCTYVGVAAVRWADNEHLLITEYVGKKSSRTLLFPAVGTEETVMVDKTALISLVPAQSRSILRDNDHVFVEGTGVQQGVLALTVWGNGQQDKRGFRWYCKYDIRGQSMACTEAAISH